MQGIYVPPSNNFPRRFHNMGIRIEAGRSPMVYDIKTDETRQDEVLVGKEHATILTVNAPKEVRC
jgi:intermediate cleaving peptidase 55